jgi:hypothetical protein
MTVGAPETPATVIDVRVASVPVSSSVGCGQPVNIAISITAIRAMPVFTILDLFIFSSKLKILV